MTCYFNSEFTLCNSVFVSATELKRKVNCDFLSHTSDFYLAIPKKKSELLDINTEFELLSCKFEISHNLTFSLNSEFASKKSAVRFCHE